MDLRNRQQSGMRIVFSRKGFDSATGGGPSPIVDGKPVSLPIPTAMASRTTYGGLGLGAHAHAASRGRIGAADACHHDPMFLADGTCLFGQAGAAQTHLLNRGVGRGDVFLFFGLFRAPGGPLHHRIFGYLEVAEMVSLGTCEPERREQLVALGHPHALAPSGANDMIWIGPGRTASSAGDRLRLTVPEGPASLWRRPGWLRAGGLSYHDRSDRWLAGGRLRSASRGQEFVAEIGSRAAPRRWLEDILRELNGP